MPNGNKWWSSCSGSDFFIRQFDSFPREALRDLGRVLAPACWQGTFRESNII